MPELEQKTFRRLIAYKARISDILNGIFTKEGFSSSVRVNGIGISRVNIIATLIYKAEGAGFTGAVIDDGTGKIPLRVFEEHKVFSKAEVGDLVLVIGKVREFGNERYIVPETVKKLENNVWMEVRKAELGSDIPEKDAGAGTKPVASGAAEQDSINEEVYMLVKRLDSGEGVSVEEIVKNSGSEEAEKILNRLLESGDIFEVKPGKLKVLE